MQLAGESCEIPFVLDHPRDGAVEAFRGAKPRTATGVVSSVGVAVVNRSPAGVLGPHVTDGGLRYPPHLPYPERARDRRDRERVRWDRPTHDRVDASPRPVHSHGRIVRRPPVINA